MEQQFFCLVHLFTSPQVLKGKETWHLPGRQQLQSFVAAPSAEPIRHTWKAMSTLHRVPYFTVRQTTTQSWQRASSLIFTPLDEWINLITYFIRKYRRT